MVATVLFYKQPQRKLERQTKEIREKEVVRLEVIISLTFGFKFGGMTTLRWG